MPTGRESSRRDFGSNGSFESINAGSLQLPAVVKLLTPVDEVVVTVVAPRLAEVEAAAPAAEEPVEGAVAPEEPPK